MIKSQTSKLSSFVVPPLPKHPFKSLPEKSCNKLDEVSIACHKNVGKNTRDDKSCRKSITHLSSPSTSKHDWSVNRTYIEENTEGKKIFKIVNKRQNKNIGNPPSTSTQNSFTNNKSNVYINQFSPISKNAGIPTLSSENDLMVSPPMFMDSPIKSGIKRSLFDVTSAQKREKNFAVRQLFPSKQSKIDSDANENDLMATSSIFNDSPITNLKGKGFFLSTPESVHKHVKYVAERQVMSSTQSETFTQGSEANVNHGCILKFITSTLPQLNSKLNKIILNQSKHEEMLKEILKNKTVQDDSFCDTADLEGFPLNNLNSLKEMDLKLQSDTLFYKCLVKRLKEFGGNNLYMVTKCIMEFLITDNLGMQISLTGRGTNNKKNEKMSLISLTMFKMITRVLLNNVSGSTIPGINKAVTG
eukprot:XP_016655720.1 PREDICTED: uncharacterized protein LOC107882192 [Acyrthosiphon pisum]